MIIDSVSSTDRQKVEAYLAYKWGLTGQLPTGHPGKLSGWSVGRNISESNDLSVNIGGVGGPKTATHSTALSSDNQWHHIVSTYDGGTRKIYLDGTEVSSESASGAVASTAATLLLGASDMNASEGTIAAARHSGIKLDEVRFYSSGLTSSQVSALYNFGNGDIGNIGDFVNLPSKISGTKGTALSTTVTAAFPNAYYEAVNLTPGLSINASTGEISGTPTVGGVGSITVIARNAAGKRAVTTIPYDSNPTGPAFSFPTHPPHPIMRSSLAKSPTRVGRKIQLIYSGGIMTEISHYPIGTPMPRHSARARKDFTVPRLLDSLPDRHTITESVRVENLTPKEFQVPTLNYGWMPRIIQVLC